MSTRSAIGVVCAAVLAASAGAAEPLFRIERTVAGLSPLAMNRAGVIAGHTFPFSPPPRAAVDVPGVGLQSIAAPWTQWEAINESGVAAGFTPQGTGFEKALRRQKPGAGVELLAQLGTFEEGGFAVGVTGDGSVVATWAPEAFETSRGIVFGPGGARTDIGSLDPQNRLFTQPNGVNAAGQITGLSWPGGFDPVWGHAILHAFRYTPGVGLVDITPGDPGSEGKAINSRGEVVGWFNGGFTRAFRFDDEVGLTDLQTGAAGITSSVALAISEDGKIAGEAGVGPRSVAFIYIRGEGMKDIGTLGGPITAVRGVNNRGEVVGMAHPDPEGFMPAEAWVYTRASGLVRLADVIRDTPPDFHIFNVVSIADDGRVLIDTLGGAVVLAPIGRCAADVNQDGVLDVQDFAAFQNAFALGELAKADVGGTAACEADGRLTISDFACFQNLFAIGCP